MIIAQRCASVLCSLAFIHTSDSSWNLEYDSHCTSGKGGRKLPLTVEEYYPGKVPFRRAEAEAPGFDTYATEGVPPESKLLILDYGNHAIHYYTKNYGDWRGYGLGEEQRGYGELLDQMYDGRISFDEMWDLADREVSRVLDEAYR